MSVGISFIVSHYNRPIALMGCIAALLQQVGDNEIIITDNSTQETAIQFAKNLCELSPRITWLDTSLFCTAEDNLTACYRAANVAVGQATKEWVCFPSDDSYYVPNFVQIMLDTAVSQDLEMVYSDFIYDPRWNQLTYTVVQAAPRYYFFDKTCFILKRDRFKGFRTEMTPENDWHLIEDLIKEGLRHGHALGVLLVHN